MLCAITSEVRAHDHVIVLLAGRSRSRGHLAGLEVVRKLVGPDVIRGLKLGVRYTRARGKFRGGGQQSGGAVSKTRSRGM